jgi:hypothetical protein
MIVYPISTASVVDYFTGGKSQILPFNEQILIKKFLKALEILIHYDFKTYEKLQKHVNFICAAMA